MELGCSYCGLLWQAVDTFCPPDGSSDKPALRFYVNIEPNKPIYIEELTTRLAVEIYTEAGRSYVVNFLSSNLQSKIGAVFSAVYLKIVYKRDRSILPLALTSSVLADLGANTWHRQEPIRSNPNNPACWDLINRWIDQCMHHHTKCCVSTSATPPTRLLFLDAKRLHIRLIESGGVSRNYAALSHC